MPYAIKITLITVCSKPPPKLSGNHPFPVLPFLEVHKNEITYTKLQVFCVWLLHLA